MTAKEENILASVDFVKAGIELQKLIESVVLIPELDASTIVNMDSSLSYMLLGSMHLGQDTEMQILLVQSADLS